MTQWVGVPTSNRPPGRKTSHEETPGFDNGSWRYGDEGAGVRRGWGLRWCVRVCSAVVVADPVAMPQA